MTEIVADKTVEVVKNAIETADGALRDPLIISPKRNHV